MKLFAKLFLIASLVCSGAAFAQVAPVTQPMDTPNAAANTAIANVNNCLFYGGCTGIPPGALVNNTNSVPNVYNYTPSSLPHWRYALSQAMQGAGPAFVVFDGDSTTFGEGGGTGGARNVTGAYVRSMPAQVGSLFSASGFSASTDSYVRPANDVAWSYAQQIAYAPGTSFSLGASTAWSGDISGSQWFINTTGTDSVTFTPSASTTNVVVYYYDNGAVFSVTDGATISASVNTTSTSTVHSASYTRTASSNGISITRTSGSVFIAGVIQYNANSTKVVVLNNGIPGVTTNAFTNGNAPNYWTPVYTGKNIPVALHVLNLGINDANTSVATATYITNISYMVNLWQSAGQDVVLVMWHPINNSTGQGNAASYYAALQSVALKYNIPLINFQSRFGSWAAGNAIGSYYDSLHMNGYGYADEAQAVWQVLRPQ